MIDQSRDVQDIACLDDRILRISIQFPGKNSCYKNGFCCVAFIILLITLEIILGDPGAVSGGEGKMALLNLSSKESERSLGEKILAESGRSIHRAVWH